MSRPDERNVREVLLKHDRALKLRNALFDAWAKLEANYPDRVWWRRKSTRAGVIWENAVDYALAALTGTDGFFPLLHDDTFSAIFDDSVLVRLKKADMELMTRNVQTLQASLFHDHGEDLFGYSGLQRVEAVYVLDRFETKIDWTGVVAREGNRHLWHFELEAAPTAVIAELPLPADRRPTRELAKLKETDADQKSDGESE